jgi:hypothetical protein
MFEELTSFLIVLIIFSCIFAGFGKEHFSGLEDETTIYERLFNRLYFTMTTISTVGYGDVYPKSMECKSVNMILMSLVTLSLITSVVKKVNIF